MTLPLRAETLSDPVNNLECFSQSDLDSLARYKKDCDILKLDLVSAKQTLKDLDAMAAPVAFWQTPEFIISGVAVSFSLGAMVGIALWKK